MVINTGVQGSSIILGILSEYLKIKYSKFQAFTVTYRESHTNKEAKR